jgi:hypothetical protein
VVKHYNTSISEDAARILNSKQGQFLGDDVTGPVAVIPIKPRVNILKRGQALNSTGATVWTTPSDKDFYLVAANLSFVKDATSTSLASRISVTVEGVAINILDCAQLTLTAQSGNMSQQFNPPIKLDRNTNITVNNSTAVANCTSVANIYGYTVETTK